MITLIEILFVFSVLAIFYHLVGYPVLLRLFASYRADVEPPKGDTWHHFVFVIPMFNEEVFIEKKIKNLSELDYPSEHFEVYLIDDGSSDKTLSFAKKALKKHPSLRLQIISSATNEGKVAIYNQIIPTLPNDCLLFFSDVSAKLSTNALQRANLFFNLPNMGAFSTNYQLNSHAMQGEKTYWQYQETVQSLESRLGSPMGYHGTGYAIRKSLWEPLDPATINDDFVMPMKVIAKGYLGVFDKQSISQELELSSEQLDWNRRVRIACGNIQQVYLLKDLFSPRFGFIAWMFFSGKGLRILLPWLFILNFLGCFILSFHKPLLFTPLLFAQCFIYCMALVQSLFNLNSKIAKIITYFVKGQVSIFMGWLRLPKHSGRWQRANSTLKSSYVHPLVKCGKWIIDKTSALFGLSLLLLLFPFIAILIKIASPGPVFYKQLRVGKGTERYTQLFYLYKFRTMYCDSKPCDSIWTEKNDPRIFPLGAFLRRTHLDELPQFLNVLKGEMSLVGPRPERPDLYPYIEKNIPFYSERLYCVRPGITGLAQVSQGPDRVIEDVRKKVSFDHAYAMHLTKPWLWLKLEMVILLKTIKKILVGQNL